MKNISIIIISLLILITGTRSAHTQPKIPVENIPVSIPAEVKSYIKELYSDKPANRVTAARKLGIIREKAKDAVPFLISMLDDTDFVLLQSDTAIKVSTSPAREAMTALINIGSPAVEPLIAACKHENTEIRKHAIDALGKMKDSRAIEPLIAARSDRRTAVRDSAYKALLQIIEGLKERQQGEKLINILKYKEPSLQQAAIEALGSIPKSGIAETLLPFLVDGNPDIRRSTTEALKKIGEAAVVPLINALYSDDIQIRINAAMILGDIKDTLSVEPLIQTLKYKSNSASIEPSTLRLEAARALGKIRDSRAVEPLITALIDKNFHVRELSAKALTAIGANSVEALIRVLKDENMESRVLVAMILGDIKDSRAVEPLIQTLLLAAADNITWSFRFEATRALGKIKDPRAIEALEIMLSDRVTTVREIAEWSLNEISGTTSEKNKKKESFFNTLF